MNVSSILLSPVVEKLDKWSDEFIERCVNSLTGSQIYFMDDYRKRKRVGFEFPTYITEAGKDTATKFIGRKFMGKEVQIMEEAVIFSDM